MKQEHSIVDISRPGPFVAVVEMSVPGELNLWTPEIERALFGALDSLSADDSVRVIGIRSRGRAFSAGGDLAGVDAKLSSRRRIEDEAGEIVARQVLRILSIPKPVIAAIHGHCVGMGFALALTCDFRIVSSDVRFQAGFPKRGFVAEHGTSWLLPRIVGLGDAMDILVSGRTVRSAEAAAMRLVHEVVEPGELESALIAFAQRLATATSPRSQAVIKRQLYRDLQLSLAESIDRTASDMVRAFRATDAREGVTSFIEGRETAFPPLASTAPLPVAGLPGE